MHCGLLSLKLYLIKKIKIKIKINRVNKCICMPTLNLTILVRLRTKLCFYLDPIVPELRSVLYQRAPCHHCMNGVP
jgi:hypothetical protein